MGYSLIWLFVLVSTPNVALDSSEIPLPPKEIYRCPPCGCSGDNLIFEEPGACTICPMTRIKYPQGVLGDAALALDEWFREGKVVEAAYTRFLYPAYVLGLFLGFFILLRRNRQRGDVYLGFFILNLALFPIQHHICSLFGAFQGESHLHFFPFAHILLTGPLLFHFFRAQATGILWRNSDLFRYLPAAMCAIFYLLLFVNFGNYGHTYTLDNRYAFFAKLEQSLAIMTAAGYLIWARLAFAEIFKKSATSITAGPFQPRKLLFPLEVLLSGWFLLLLADLLLYRFTTAPITFYPLWFILAPFFYLLGLKFLASIDSVKSQAESRPAIIAEFPRQPLTGAPGESNPDTRGLEREEIARLAQKLTNLMKDERPFLDPDLNLDTLANLMDMPAKNLTVVIREGLETNFYDLLNCYRIEDVKSRLRDPSLEHQSILSLAMDAGFRSKSHFNQVFKQRVQQTPGQFRRQMCG